MASALDARRSGPYRCGVFRAPRFSDYALLDSGGGEKLERLGPFVLRRPDPRALWAQRLAQADWNRADLRFELDPESGGKRGRWLGGDAAERGWSASYAAAGLDGPVRFHVRPGSFRHVGVFPEQAANWSWMVGLARPLHRAGPEPPRLLNLFGYTGIASLVARRAGFHVTHVDASKTALTALRENLALSGLASDGLRMLCDDALAFARREVRRGSRYAGILVDPPHHGRGPKGELWQLGEHLAPLIDVCAELVGERAFLCLSTYATTTSPLGLANLFGALAFAGGEVTVGELALEEDPHPSSPSRSLPCGACARWTRGLHEAGVE